MCRTEVAGCTYWVRLSSFRRNDPRAGVSSVHSQCFFEGLPADIRQPLSRSSTEAGTAPMASCCEVCSEDNGYHRDDCTACLCPCVDITRRTSRSSPQKRHADQCMLPSLVAQVISSEGIGALTIGLGPTLCRNCIWNSLYYGASALVCCLFVCVRLERSSCVHDMWFWCSQSVRVLH